MFGLTKTQIRFICESSTVCGKDAWKQSQNIKGCAYRRLSNELCPEFKQYVKKYRIKYEVSNDKKIT